MSSQLRTRPPSLGAPHRVDLLLSCRQRTRHFGTLARRLGGPAEAPDEEGAAAAVHRHHQVALPPHVTDEDRSPRPRLLAQGPSRQARSAMAAMSTEEIVREMRCGREPSP